MWPFGGGKSKDPIPRKWLVDNSVDEKYANVFNRPRKELKKELSRLEDQLSSNSERISELEAEHGILRMEFDDLLEEKEQLKSKRRSLGKGAAKGLLVDQQKIETGLKMLQSQVSVKGAAHEEAKGQQHTLKSSRDMIQWVVNGTVTDQSELTVKFEPPNESPYVRILDTFEGLEDLDDLWADEEE